MGNDLNYWIEYFEKSAPNMLPANFKSVREYIRRKKAKNVREQTLANQLLTLTQFGTWCRRLFLELDENDLLEYSEFLDRQTYMVKKKPRKYKVGTKYAKLATVKAFLKEINPEAVKSITIKSQSTKKLPEDLMNKEEIENLLDNCPNARDRALIATLYESGMRKGELFSIKIKNVQFDENGTVITIPDGKTGARRIRLVFATSFLREWLEVHPLKNKREADLFCSLREPYPRLTDSGLRTQLTKITKKAGVQKRTNPHSFRHARATHLAEHLTEQQLKKYLGWTEGSSMAAVYVHLSGKDIDNAILKMNGIQIEDTHTDGLKVGRCPRCKELNPETSAYCGKCGLPLQEEIRASIEKDSTDADLLLMEIIAKNPDFYKALAEEINRLHNNKNQA